MEISETNIVPGWDLNVNDGIWNGGYFGNCDKGWFGWGDQEAIGTISTTLYGQGSSFITFGNCWMTGVVKLFANGSEISSAGPNSQITVALDFDNTII